MILAVSVPEKLELVIAAADNVDVQRAFLGRIQDESPELIQDTDFTRFLVEADLSGFAMAPTILQFPTGEALTDFIDSNGIELTNFANAHGRQRKMLAAEEFRQEDGRTLAEVHNLVENDPWDRRTDEEKAQAEENRKKMKERRSKGELTEDSWGGGKGSMGGSGGAQAAEPATPGGPIPAGVLPVGDYWMVTVAGTLGNDAAGVAKIYETHDAGEPFAPVYQADVDDDIVMFVFEKASTAELFAADLRQQFIHVSTVLVSPINERGDLPKSKEITINDDGSVSMGDTDDAPIIDTTPNRNDPNAKGGATGGDTNPDEESTGGLRIRDIEIDIDPVTGEVRIGRVVAEKDMFGADMFHLTLMTANGEPSSNKDDYDPILKRAGLAENTRYLGWEYKFHEKGGIIIELGGAATLRMEGALTESGREYTLTCMAEEKEDFNPDNPYRISHDNMVEIYFRVDVRGHNLEEVLPIAKEAKEPYRSNDVGPDCWLAYVRERFASDVIAALAVKGITGELAEVDPEGERYIEEGAGAKVIDKGAAQEEPPAPWNDRAPEYYALSEEEQAKARIKLLPWLLYCLRDYGAPHRIIAHITPKTYFNKHGVMWDGDFPFDDLLPDTYEKYGTKVGVYQNKAMDLNTADYMLGNQRGMKESLNLMAHVNSIGVERVDG